MNKSLINTFTYIKKQLQSYLNDEFKEYNLKSSEIFFMHILHTQGELSQIEISKILECDKSHIHRTLVKLIDKNYIKYVEYEHNEHIKNLKLTLTEQGEEISKKFDKAMKKWDKAMKAGLTIEEIKTAKKVALKIIDNALNFKNTESKNV